MNTRFLLESMEAAVKVYRTNAVASINRNRHMNRLGGDCGLSQHQIDAVLVDFINNTASRNGVDYGLYAKDLGPEVPIVPTGSCCPSHAAQQQEDIETEKSIYGCDVVKLFGSLIAAREVADEEMVMGFISDSETNDLFKVTIEYIGKQS